MPDPVPDGYPELDDVMRAARVFTGVVAASLAHVGDAVTSAQLRVLVLVGTRENTNASGVAAELDVHLSSASRLIDRLVSTGLIARSESPTDRRQVRLSLTAKGSSLLDEIMEHRRGALSAILGRMGAPERQALGRSLARFSEAAGEPVEPVWSQV